MSAMTQPSEARTWRDKIDSALQAAGWDLDNRAQVGFEIPVDGYDAEPWNGITDYSLYRSNVEIIAIVEAVRQSRDPSLAQAQAPHDVTQIATHQSFTPFTFLTNGTEIYFWDFDSTFKRLVSGFSHPMTSNYSRSQETS